MVTWLCNLRNRGVATRAMVLVAVVLAALAATTPVAIRMGGYMALAAAAVAAVLCLAGAAVALIIVARFRSPNGALAALLLGIAVRTGVPFAVGMAVHLHGGPLARAGLLWYLLLFYAIALTVGTMLSLPPTKRQAVPAR